jgi:PAS domain S-box-containing protein
MMEVETAKWLAIINAVVDAVILIGERGIIEDANPAAYSMFGYTRDELIGQNVSILMPEPYHSEHDRHLRQYRKTRKPQIIGVGREMAAIRKDGVIFPVKLSVGEAHYGETRLFVGVIHDLTEARRNEESLRQAQKVEVIAQLSTGIAHDFNNLLNVIQGNLGMMEKHIHHPEGFEILTEVLDAIDDSSQFIKRLLVYGRRQYIQQEMVDINHLIRRFIGFARRSIGGRIEIRYNLADNLPSVFVDPAQFEAALLNIIVNASDAMFGVGCIDITTHLDRETGRDRVNGNCFVKVEVRDTGHGMTKETLSHIFEPFFTTKQATLGTGLGLSMVQGFVKKSHGEIKVVSHPGKGTTVSLLFSVTIPSSNQDGPD